MGENLNSQGIYLLEIDFGLLSSSTHKPKIHWRKNDQLDTLVHRLLLFVEMPSDMYVRLSDQQVH